MLISFINTSQRDICHKMFFITHLCTRQNSILWLPWAISVYKATVCSEQLAVLHILLCQTMDNYATVILCQKIPADENIHFVVRSKSYSLIKFVFTIECTADISSGSIIHEPTSVRWAVYTGHSCPSFNGIGNGNCGFNFVLFFFGSRRSMF